MAGWFLKLHYHYYIIVVICFSTHEHRTNVYALARFWFVPVFVSNSPNVCQLDFRCRPTADDKTSSFIRCHAATAAIIIIVKHQYQTSSTTCAQWAQLLLIIIIIIVLCDYCYELAKLWQCALSVLHGLPYIHIHCCLLFVSATRRRIPVARGHENWPANCRLCRHTQLIIIIMCMFIWCVETNLLCLTLCDLPSHATHMCRRRHRRRCCCYSITVRWALDTQNYEAVNSLLKLDVLLNLLSLFSFTW